MTKIPDCPNHVQAPKDPVAAQAAMPVRPRLHIFTRPNSGRRGHAENKMEGTSQEKPACQAQVATVVIMPSTGGEAAGLEGQPLEYCLATIDVPWHEEGD